MMDKEKVIEGLCDAIGIIHGHVPKRYLGYGEQACRDAISMLKEQEETIKNLDQEIRDKNIRLKERAEQVDSMLKEQKELVRCADCRHADISQSGLIKCRGIFRSREWYCADGERK